MKKDIISASILSADVGCLAKEADMALDAGANWLHIDVMDQHFVPNLTFGPLICEALRRHLPNAFLDVHLMVEPVDTLIIKFAQKGASQISFHPEASNDPIKNLKKIRELGCKAGLAINPETTLDSLDPFWNHLNFILMMSVNPGFPAQTFIPKVLTKISHVKHLIQKKNLMIRLGVDGGIKENNIARVKKAGADTFIVGSAIFKSSNYVELIQKLRYALLHEEQ